MQIRFNFRKRPYVLTVLELAPEPESDFSFLMGKLQPFLPMLGGIAGWYFRDHAAKQSRRHDRIAGMYRGREKMREEIAEVIRQLSASGQLPKEVSILLAPYLDRGVATDGDHDHTGEPPMDAHGLKVLLDDVNALAGMAGKMEFRTMETLCRGKLAQLRAYHGRGMIDDDTYETTSMLIAATLQKAGELADKCAREADAKASPADSDQAS